MKAVRIRALMFVVAFVAACAGTQTPTSNSPSTATTAAVPAASDDRSLTGKYACHLTIKGTTYPAAECEIVPGDLEGVLWIEKLQGTQRFAGEVTRSPQGFTFSGYFYCPQGACDEEVSADFASTGDGGFAATIKTSHGPVNVTLKRE